MRHAGMPDRKQVRPRPAARREEGEMTEAPKRIWAWPDFAAGWMTGSWSANTYSADPVAEYILAAEHDRIMAEKDERIKELEVEVDFLKSLLPDAKQGDIILDVPIAESCRA
jgi:hypothetical protein